MHKAVIYAVTGLLVFWLGAFADAVYAYPQHLPQWTNVEKKFLATSGRQATYPQEYLPVIELRNPYELGKITALRFIEWAIDNPKGVVALTSGTTPEFFIKFLNHYKKQWHKADVQAELRSVGINSKKFPDTSNMKFVQLEEIYPISPLHHKNIYNYVSRHYIKFLGLKKENILLMDLTSRGILAEKGLNVVFMNGKIDLSIMQRKPGSQLEVWQQQAIKEARAFCVEYENKIRSWGGIDFLLGSLSYGGNLGSIPSGSPANGKTTIVKLDYRAAAHAAKDLGGIEHARGKLVVTIGLGTIAIKPKATMIIIASGESKAQVVRDSIENKANIKYPSTMLQQFPNSRMYVTASAAKLLDNRRTEDFAIKSKYGWTQKLTEEVIIEIAQREKKAIADLTIADISRYERGKLLLESPPKALPAMLHDVHASLISKIEQGIKINSGPGTKILHTGPHHDDIMLGYYPLVDAFTYKYKNHFAYITSGFNSVSDAYVLATINRASDWWLNKEQDLIFNKPYDKIINKFRAYFVKQDVEQMAMLDTIILLKHLVTIYNLKDIDQLKQTIRWLKDDYFPSKLPGGVDVANIKLLKGMMRESEVDRLWSLKNIALENITHLRSRFYTGKEYTKTPRLQSDVIPFLNLYNSYQPDIITVNDDPQGAPPLTHYKAMQLIAQALRNQEAMLKPDLKIWGYRNIWFRYSFQDANIYVPVSAHMQEAQKRAFLSCFNTQKSASFPSPFYEGDFATLIGLIQSEQLMDLKTLLGPDYFAKNQIPEIKNATGLILLNQMNLDEFFQRAEDLQQAMELEKTFESSKPA